MSYLIIFFGIAACLYMGLTAWCCCAVASQADDEMERIIELLVKNGGIQ